MVAKQVFTKLIDIQTQRLSEKAYILSSDFSFKQVVATQDRPTILSSLENLLFRIEADMAVLVSKQYQILADTAHPTQTGLFFATELIKKAEQQGMASSIVFVDGEPYQTVVTPVMAPNLIAWLCISIKLDQMRLDELQQLTLTDISLLFIPKDSLPVLISSSLSEVDRKLVSDIQGVNWQQKNTFNLKLKQTHYINSSLNLSSHKQGDIIAVMHKSLNELLEPFYQLQWVLLLIAAASLLLAFMGSLFISRSVSRPVKALVSGVRAVGKGDYDYRIKVTSADEMGELSQAFNEMAIQHGLQKTLRQAKESAESASQAKSDFLANMSHELRTPLNSILGYAQILKTQDYDAERQVKALNIIENSGQHLLNLINEILDLSKIEAGLLQLQANPFNLKQLLDIITDLVRQKAESKNLLFTLKYDFDESIWVHGDEQRLRQILINLLNNAIKYTETGEVIFIVNKTSAKHFHFCVKDTGIGIHADHLQLIFSSFQQLHQTQDLIEGTGLGLAISKQLVQLFGSELKVSSQLGIGSQFEFEIELEEVRSEETHLVTLSNKTVTKKISGQGHVILIADDIALNRSLLRDMLSPMGFLIIEVDNGLDCIEQTLKNKPDIILMDSRMPVMDGLETCRKIRHCSDIMDTVVLIVSANVFESHRQQCLAAGADGFVEKPIYLDALLTQLERFINLYPDSLQVESVNSEPIVAEQIIYPIKKDLESLLNYAQQGDIQAIREFIKNIRQYDQNSILFTEQVLVLANNFQINKIRTLLKEGLEKRNNNS